MDALLTLLGGGWGSTRGHFRPSARGTGGSAIPCIKGIIKRLI